MQNPLLEPILEQTGVTLGIFPLTHDGVAFGVVEVVGPTAIMQERGAILSAIVGQSGLVFSGARVQAEAERAVAEMNALLRLACELVLATTASEVIRQTVKACHDHLRVPVAGLFPDRDGWGWFLAASEGMNTARLAKLRASLLTSRVGPDGKRLRIPSLRARFRQSLGCRDVVTIRAGSAVFFAGDVPGGHENFLEGLSPLVSGALSRHGLNGTRSRRRAPSEIGIAWTAHELRAPLLGAKAALDLVSQAPGRDGGQELLIKTRQELGRLSDLIDPLLRWSSGTEMLRRRYVDLVEVTREAVASSSLGVPSDRIVVSAPDRQLVRGDPQQLRSAIANVVRNALTYSPLHASVKVGVEADYRSARVVVSDEGTGIPQGERDAIFEPFNRGRSPGAPRGGSGLGLFIARRVLEAHGGSIVLRPSRVGATFELEIPVDGWQLCAS
jgi:signal transduction histidine kinase